MHTVTVNHREQLKFSTVKHSVSDALHPGMHLCFVRHINTVRKSYIAFPVALVQPHCRLLHAACLASETCAQQAISPAPACIFAWICVSKTNCREAYFSASTPFMTSTMLKQ